MPPQQRWLRCGGPSARRSGRCVRPTPCRCRSTGTTISTTSGGTSAAGSPASSHPEADTRPVSSASPTPVGNSFMESRKWAQVHLVSCLFSSSCLFVAAGSGRTAWSSGSKRPDVVGNVILHDKLDLWKSSKGAVHYHQGTELTNVSPTQLRALLWKFCLENWTLVWMFQVFSLVKTPWTFSVLCERLAYSSLVVSRMSLSRTLEPPCCQTTSTSWPRPACTTTPTPSPSTARSSLTGRTPGRRHPVR